MMAKLETRQILVAWALILIAGLAAGEWGGRRARARTREALVTEAKAFAVAVAPDQPQGGGDDPSYSAVRDQLVRLQQTDARVRWVFLLRPAPAAGRAGPGLLLSRLTRSPEASTISRVTTSLADAGNQ